MVRPYHSAAPSPQRIVLLLLLALVAAAWVPRLACSLPVWGKSKSQEDDVAGPVVKLPAQDAGLSTTGSTTASGDAAAAAAVEGRVNAASANATSEPEKADSTIAQILDKALQKEFKEETDADAASGTNFNAPMQSDEVGLGWRLAREAPGAGP